MPVKEFNRSLRIVPGTTHRKVCITERRGIWKRSGRDQKGHRHSFHSYVHRQRFCVCCNRDETNES